jgi:hypothetical protein
MDVKAEIYPTFNGCKYLGVYSSSHSHTPAAELELIGNVFKLTNEISSSQHV